MLKRGDNSPGDDQSVQIEPILRHLWLWRESVRSWRWWPGVWLATLIAVAILGSSLPHPPPHGQGTQGYVAQGSEKVARPISLKEDSDARLADYTLALVVATGALVFVALVQTGVFGAQASRLKETIGQMRKTEERQLRAYVFPKGIDIYNVANSGLPVEKRTAAHYGDKGKGPVVQLEIWNFGQTPAYKVVIHSHISVEDFDFDFMRGVNLSYNTASQDTMGPSNGSTQARRLPKPLSAKEVAGLKAGTKAIYFWGRIDYTDAFGKVRWSTFAYYHNANSGAVGINGAMTSCKNGNDGDRELPQFSRVPLLARIAAALRG